MPKLLQVEVVRLGSDARSFKMCRRTTAGMLKHKLSEDSKVAPECLTLVFNSQHLDDAALLSSLSLPRDNPVLSLTCITSCERVYRCLEDPSISLHRRRNALQALVDVAQWDYQRAVNVHMQCLERESTDRLTVEVAVEGLVRIAQKGGEAVREMIITMAYAGMEDEKNEAVRAGCAEILGRVGSRNLDRHSAIIENKLLQASGDASYEVRAAVVTAFARLISSNISLAFSAVIKFTSDESACVREAAAVALGNLMNKDEHSVAALKKLALDPCRFVRTVAATSLKVAPADR